MKTEKKVRLGIVSLIVITIIVITIAVPIPAFPLDIMIWLNILLNIFILHIAEYSKKTTDFSLFPALFIVSAHLSLLVNISATRLIFTKGVDFDGYLIRFAASWIEGSGGIVPLSVGFAFFTAVLVIHIIWVVKRAARTAKAAAWFTVDGMQEKQTAINAKLGTGIIDEKEAIARRELLQKQNDFCLAMDGAVGIFSLYEKIKIVIFAITIFGGCVLGVLFFEGVDTKNLIMDAAKIYVPLIIGNGIVSVVPAHLISIAAGIVSTELYLRD